MQCTKELLEEITTVSQIRAAFYSYFSKLFKEPVQEDFIGLTEQFMPHFKQLAEFVGSKEIDKAVKDMESYLKLEKSLKDQQAHLDELNRQFTGLFLLGRNSIPTSASVYLSSEKLLKREPWERACRTYRARGFKLPENFNEPEDHIAMELLYLQKLSDLMISVIEKDMTDKIEEILKEQKKFIDEEVLTWIPDFAKLTLKHAETSKAILYGAAGVIISEFLQYDSGLTEELLNA